MKLEEVIKLRRNVKPIFFTGEIISDCEVKDVLESANWAPTHGYTEPWRFVVFSGASKMKLAEFQSDLYKSKTDVTSFKQIKFEKLLKTPSLASHIIAVVVYNSINHRVPLIEEVAATSCAVQNMLLSAAEKKIAVHWTTGGVTYDDEMKSFLGFENKDVVLGFLYLGRSKNKINSAGRRGSTIEQKITWKS